MKILIVEDEPSLRELMQKTLAKERYVVETAGTFHEASLKIADYSYDCILPDIKSISACGGYAAGAITCIVDEDVRYVRNGSGYVWFYRTDFNS